MSVQRITFGELSERLRAYEQTYGYSTIESLSALPRWRTG